MFPNDPHGHGYYLKDLEAKVRPTLREARSADRPGASGHLRPVAVLIAIVLGVVLVTRFAAATFA